MILSPHRLVPRLSSFLTPKRLMVWGAGLLAVSWSIYIHTTAGPGLVDRIGRFKGEDFIQFYVMGSLVREHRPGALYDPSAHVAEGRQRIDPQLTRYASHPNYGPQIALAFAPLAALPFAWSLRAFLALSVVCYGVSVWLVWRECDRLRSHGALVAVLAAASPHLFTVMRYGQASAFSLLMCTGAFVALRRNRPLVAGLAIGCLAYKPQLAAIIGCALLFARQWRVVIGAAIACCGQLAIGWLVAGTAAMAHYFGVLWTLAKNPALAQLYPSEVHSLRGFCQLIVPSAAVVTACSLLGIVVVLAAAIRTWSSGAPLGVRWSMLVVATILASPHLLTYDLLLLTIPMIALADWCVTHEDHVLQPAVSVLLVVLYFSPFSAIIARVTGVQVSVIAMALLSWRIYTVCTEGRDFVSLVPFVVNGRRYSNVTGAVASVERRATVAPR